jgi:hypothetical protein
MPNAWRVVIAQATAANATKRVTTAIVALDSMLTGAEVRASPIAATLMLA